MESSQSWTTISLLLRQSTIALRILIEAMQTPDIDETTKSIVVGQLEHTESEILSSLSHEHTLARAAENVVYEDLVADLSNANTPIDDSIIEDAVSWIQNDSDNY